MKYLWAFEIDAVWVLVPACSVLFALGGSGLKEIRRFGIPTLIGSSAISLGHNIFICLFSSLILMATLIAGYGDGKRREFGDYYYAFLFFLGCLYGLALFPYRYDWQGIFLSVFIGAIFSSATLLSNTFRWFEWKLVEMAVGASIGLCACILIG